MIGNVNDVAAKLKRDNGNLLDMHCIVHRLALSSLDAAKKVKDVNYSEGILHLLHSFFCLCVIPLHLKTLDDLESLFW